MCPGRTADSRIEKLIIPSLLIYVRLLIDLSRNVTKVTTRDQSENPKPKKVILTSLEDLLLAVL